ncbi:hypothetical protein AQUSIP_09170 [Aquicella siphonis]|uniref:IgA Peptidase M64 n=1 Tax=Aquicella siphonis TaxID=254247 RepID=A0A5E4PGP2_9COXI|nr:M64 family metallopeptidase [Aquicella siphonis]VVC75627.1 hypothetical protein AQUSIP_09170 [Aquicella siphonis]
MRLVLTGVMGILWIMSQAALANPYWDPQKVPPDTAYSSSRLKLPDVERLKTVNNDQAIDVLRIQIDWRETDETYHVSKMIIEPSGTPALIRRSGRKPRFGSYLGVLRDSQGGATVYYDSIGTGKEYRRLARAVNLRFPVPVKEMTFELYAENPDTGVMERVVSQAVSPGLLEKQPPVEKNVVIKELSASRKSPSLRVTIYAEGYLKNEEKAFWQHAMKTVQVLQNEKFPGIDYMSFYGVFQASDRKLGKPENLGFPVPEYGTSLGLYYPYWDNFGRWYNIVYPTREDKFRSGLAVAAYDYPLVLVNDSGYWGVGNYMSHTAVPAANNYYFTYLLLHEFGHFFGLNEEYEGGGRTELEFAYGINEPWSQNITFLTDTRYENLKWKSFVDASTQLPTPDSAWHSSPPVYGAYRGGYADSTGSYGRSHKPGLNCVMEDKKHFCDICTRALQDVILDSLGYQE